MVVHARQKVKSETKDSTGEKNMKLNFLYCIDFFTMMLTVDKTTNFLVHSRIFHMELDLMQRIRANLFVNRFGPSGLPLIDIYMVIVTLTENFLGNVVRGQPRL